MQLLSVFQFGAVGNGDVFRQVQQLAAGERLAKVLTGDIRQLMGFIEDHHFRLGDQLGKAALFDHHIGQKQVMVDHHHVGVHRFLRAFTTKQSLYSGQSLPRQLSLVLVTSGQA